MRACPLHEKVAIITGAGRGIGRDISLRFAAEGARVLMADLDEAAARQGADEVRAAGGHALPYSVDITDPKGNEAMVALALREFGRVDILVNNAGVGLAKSFLATTPEELDRTVRVNLNGTFLCGQAVARAMVPRQSGCIVNIASISGQRGGTDRAAYGASKAGVILLTKVMAMELAPHGIRVNALAPGPVDTVQSRETHTQRTRDAYAQRILLGRYGTGEEMAAAALFLASSESSFITGEILNVDGGFNAAGLIFEREAAAISAPANGSMALSAHS